MASVQHEREALGGRLRELRRRSGLTGAVLATRLGWAHSKVSKLENGRQTPSDADVRGWCAECGPEGVRELEGLLRADCGETRLDPRTVAWDSYGADLVIGALVPGVRKRMCAADDGSGEWTLWLLEAGPPGGSWASVDYRPGADRFIVEQYGPRMLWDETAPAYLHWVSLGRPEGERFGLSVRPEGHRLWLDTPARTIG